MELWSPEYRWLINNNNNYTTSRRVRTMISRVRRNSRNQATKYTLEIISRFVCLFVCCYKTRNSILCSLCLEGGNIPWEWSHTDSVYCPVFVWVVLFVCIKPENLYFAPCVWREVITPGNGCTRTQAQTTCVRQRQRHKPRTCQSMANTLQVDGLAHITGLTQAPYKTHPQPPNWPPPTPYYSVVEGNFQ